MSDVKPLGELTLNELKETAKSLGVEDIEPFKNKASLLATIKALQKSVVVKVKDDEKKDKEQWKSKYMRMRDNLIKQDKVSLFVPTEGKETPGEFKVLKSDYPFIWGADQIKVKRGVFKTAQLNGFKVVIPKGIMVEVPKQVAELIGGSLTATAMALRRKLLDRSEDVKKALT